MPPSALSRAEAEQRALWGAAGLADILVRAPAAATDIGARKPATAASKRPLPATVTVRRGRPVANAATASPSAASPASTATPPRAQKKPKAVEDDGWGGQSLSEVLLPSKPSRFLNSPATAATPRRAAGKAAARSKLSKDGAANDDDDGWGGQGLGEVSLPAKRSRFLNHTADTTSPSPRRTAQAGRLARQRDDNGWNGLSLSDVLEPSKPPRFVQDTLDQASVSPTSAPPFARGASLRERRLLQERENLAAWSNLPIDKALVADQRKSRLLGSETREQVSARYSPSRSDEATEQ